MSASSNRKFATSFTKAGTASEDPSPTPGKESDTTSGNDDYGSTEREPDDGHDRVDEPKPHL